MSQNSLPSPESTSAGMPADIPPTLARALILEDAPTIADIVELEIFRLYSDIRQSRETAVRRYGAFVHYRATPLFYEYIYQEGGDQYSSGQYLEFQCISAPTPAIKLNGEVLTGDDEMYYPLAIILAARQAVAEHPQ